MPRPLAGKLQERIIHIRVSDDLRKILRIRAAEADITVSEYIRRCIPGYTKPGWRKAVMGKIEKFSGEAES